MSRETRFPLIPYLGNSLCAVVTLVLHIECPGSLILPSVDPEKRTFKIEAIRFQAPPNPAQFEFLVCSNCLVSIDFTSKSRARRQVLLPEEAELGARDLTAC